MIDHALKLDRQRHQPRKPGTLRAAIRNDPVEVLDLLARLLDRAFDEQPDHARGEARDPADQRAQGTAKLRADERAARRRLRDADLTTAPESVHRQDRAALHPADALGVSPEVGGSMVCSDDTDVPSSRDRSKVDTGVGESFAGNTDSSGSRSMGLPQKSKGIPTSE